MRAYRVFKTRQFARWMRKAGLADVALKMAVIEMEQGLIDAHLGGGIVKKRVPLPGRGKSGSTRTLVATNRDDRWIFVFGFEKNEMENIDAEELRFLQLFAHDLLRLTWPEIEVRLRLGSLMEINGEA
jgi:hypothetical protein